MKKLLYIFLFVLCGIIFVISSCSKDKTPEPSVPCTSCQKVTEAKDFFAFKVGSWWVYEEETSHERDSMYVTSSSMSSGYQFDTYVYSALQGYYYYYYPFYSAGNQSCSETQPVNQKCLYVKRSKFKPGDYVGEDKCFFVRYFKGDYANNSGNIYYPNNKIIIEDVLSAYELGNFDFGTTIKVHELNTRIEGIQPTNHYFSKNVGLIKKELIDSNEVWNLVNYYIEP